MRRDEGRHEETDRTSSHEHGGVRDEPAEAIGGGMARTPRIHPAYRSYPFPFHFVHEASVSLSPHSRRIPVGSLLTSVPSGLRREDRRDR